MALSLAASVPAAAPHRAAPHISMRHIRLFQFDDASSQIDDLEGTLVAAKPGKIIDLNDVNSYGIQITKCRVVVPAATMAALINRHVVPASGAGITDARISFAGNTILIKGKLHKIGLPLGFTAVSVPEVTPRGDLRLRIIRMKAAGVFSKGFLDRIGLGTAALIKSHDPNVLRIDGDSLIIPVSGMFPAPQLYGKLTAVHVADNGIVVTMGRNDASAYSDKASRPYITVMGGAIRFAHIIMPDANLKIVPVAREAEFRFSPAHYYAQMTGGYSRATEDYGLIGYFADYHGPRSARH
ncbi:hypothetical protein FHS31_000271 [Sphingomonas vulcanisoli]|uniref:DUF3616 domain-containing protein n=1 Tax=Sphingomonas vulcanisoli TaxID=1658060 RepID=A0ABX0TPK2_9SPHN|nr:hypothetical protein [Sphingomonas vulcanisoli]NIJ06689.1 hypothetical protein [Sphingomonas vulcanisoli]